MVWIFLQGFESSYTVVACLLCDRNLQVESLLAREEDHPCSNTFELDQDDSEPVPVQDLPVQGAEGACVSEPLDLELTAKAYIEALEPIKFDTAELVVGIHFCHLVTWAPGLFYCCEQRYQRRARGLLHNCDDHIFHSFIIPRSV